MKHTLFVTIPSSPSPASSSVSSIVVAAIITSAFIDRSSPATSLSSSSIPMKDLVVESTKNGSDVDYSVICRWIVHNFPRIKTSASFPASTCIHPCESPGHTEVMISMRILVVSLLSRWVRGHSVQPCDLSHAQHVTWTFHPAMWPLTYTTCHLELIHAKNDKRRRHLQASPYHRSTSLAHLVEDNGGAPLRSREKKN